jgi:membrane protease YdiL (CAAX protease family)
MSFTVAAAIWATVVALAAFVGVWNGLGGRRFILALGIAAALFGFELFLAAPRVLDGVQRTLHTRGGAIAPLVPLFAVLVYAFGVTGDWRTMLVGAAYTVLPAMLVAASIGKSTGTWEDYAAVLLIWLPVEFRWMYGFFPYPPVLTHTIAVLLAISTAAAAFVLLRRLDGIGYAVEWRRGFGWHVALTFIVLAAIVIPLGMKIHFLAWDPTFARVRSLPLFAPGILLFTSWPEEFLFRGLLQNLLSRTFNNRWGGLAVASVIFGLSHIFHEPYPNWKYVLLATIAGLFYGHAWMKTGSLLPGTLVHALVDISWHILFR